MADLIAVSVEMRGVEEIIARFDGLPMARMEVLKDKIGGLIDELRALVRENLSGVKLIEQSGLLYNSIQKDLQSSGDVVEGRVYSEGVPYAAIQEYGGHTSPHEIVMTNAKALRFEAYGKTVFAKKVNHPGSKIPEARYMRGALEQMLPRIRQAFGVSE